MKHLAKIFTAVVGVLVGVVFCPIRAHGSPGLTAGCAGLVSGDPPLSAASRRYLAATLRSLSRMRAPNGFLHDTTTIRGQVASGVAVDILNPFTSMTNIAADLLTQLALIEHPGLADAAYANLNLILATLERLDFHQPTGLFFSWYSTDEATRVLNHDVPAIDNLHLAIALWTVRKLLPMRNFSIVAERLFKRMDFSAFYNGHSGLIGGNLRSEDGAWTLEAYEFSNLGSEARALYSAGWALGLFPILRDHNDYLKAAFSALKAEVYRSPEGDILKLWDGAAFQLFFPKIFVGEELYSATLAEHYRASANYMIAEGSRRGLLAPAAHSATRGSLMDLPGEPAYRDKSGHRALVSSDNRDLLIPHLHLNWESVFSPYALFLAATTSPQTIIPIFEKLEAHTDGVRRLFNPEVGWMEALHVEGPRTGQVVPVQLALNQSMIALSLLQILSADGSSPAGRAMNSEPVVRERLQRFYTLFDEILR